MDTQSDIPCEGHQQDSDLPDNYNIVLAKFGEFKTSFPVSHKCYGMIQGSMHATRHGIERETSTRITVPGRGIDGDIQVFGALRRNVAEARRQIEVIAANASNWNRQATHFICIPLAHEAVRERFLEFKEEVQSLGLGLDEALFQKPAKIHLTFGVVDDLEKCSQLLNECQESIFRPLLQRFGSIKFRVKGIDHMDDQPASSMTVLYAKVESEALQTFADELVSAFIKKDLIVRPRARVLLHVTLMNSAFLKHSDDSAENAKKLSSDHRRRHAPHPFDGRVILDKLADFDFGEHTVSEVHISRLRSEKAENGFYECDALAKIC